MYCIDALRDIFRYTKVGTDFVVVELYSLGVSKGTELKETLAKRDVQLGLLSAITLLGISIGSEAGTIFTNVATFAGRVVLREATATLAGSLAATSLTRLQSRQLDDVEMTASALTGVVIGSSAGAVWNCLAEAKGLIETL